MADFTLTIFITLKLRLWQIYMKSNEYLRVLGKLYNAMLSLKFPRDWISSKFHYFSTKEAIHRTRKRDFANCKAR